MKNYAVFGIACALVVTLWCFVPYSVHPILWFEIAVVFVVGGIATAAFTLARPRV